MIGNDIIDLNLAKKASNWKRKGFLEKQFTKKEKALIRNANDCFKMVWLLWSMKESAYKIYTQQNEERFFSPKKFECHLSTNKHGIVCFQNQEFFTKSLLNDNYIFTISSLENETKIHSEILKPSEVEKSIKNQLAEELGFKANEINKRKSRIGAPNYYYQGNRLTKSCSISHHGNHGAFSLLLY